MKNANSRALRPRPASPAKSGAKRRITPRQQKFVKEVTRGKSSRQAALAAGYSERSARHPSEILARPAVKAALADLMPSLESIAAVVTDGFSATRSYPTDDGVVEYVDHPTRLKFAEFATKIRGEMPGLKIEGDVNSHIEVIVTHVGRR